MKSLSLKEIADTLGAKLIGNAEEQITGLNGIMEAEKGDIAFLANPKYKEYLPMCKASAVIVGLDVEVPDVNLLQIENPRLAYAKTMLLMFPPKAENTQISDRAFIAETAELGENATVYPGVYIGDRTRIGKNAVIYPGAYIGDDVQIAAGCGEPLAIACGGAAGVVGVAGDIAFGIEEAERLAMGVVRPAGAGGLRRRGACRHMRVIDSGAVAAGVVGVGHGAPGRIGDGLDKLEVRFIDHGRDEIGAGGAA